MPFCGRNICFARARQESERLQETTFGMEQAQGSEGPRALGKTFAAAARNSA